jgi:predicted DNA-binding protein (MmcQ/YjbR family)
MDVEWLRKVCLSLPHTTEQIQWGSDLLFKVHGKMFAITPLEPAPVCLSFKCSKESFAELTERSDIIPAPYLARANWVALEKRDAIARAELAELLRTSYGLVLAKLPKKLRESVGDANSKAMKTSAKDYGRKKRKFEKGLGAKMIKGNRKAKQ